MADTLISKLSGGEEIIVRPLSSVRNYAALEQDSLEALAKIKLSRELEPLNLRTNALEGQFLLHAGQSDAAIERLQKTIDLDPNFWLAHLFAASAYTEKGMYEKAVSEGREAKRISPLQNWSIAFGGYALAKAGRQAEARATLDELRESSKTLYVPPYHFALIYNGLGETGKALDYLEKGFAEKDVRMVFLKVEPKWNTPPTRAALY